MIKGFSHFLMETIGCGPDTAIPLWKATCNLDTDVSELFPFINAIVDDAKYYDKPHYIEFQLDGIRCALYPDNVATSFFEDRDQALRFINRLIDFLNDLEARTESLEPDHNTYKPVPVFEIFKLLPQTNCRECGFSACMAFAAALSKREIGSNQCPELNKPGNENGEKLQSMLS
jgi:ArsR family metal-binding transcriptional regulator